MESSSLFEFDLPQSLPLCCALAVVGGILEVGATAVTAVPSVREAQGKDMKPCLYYMALAGNVTLQLTCSTLSHLIAPWFGPVSIVVPFFYASTSLSNMGIFGWLLGLEFFSKIMRVGTFVIVVGVILLPVVGPATQEKQNINDLLLHIYAMTWFGLLCISMTITGIMVFFVDITKYPMASRISILLIARASSISINLAVSRSFICAPSDILFTAFLVLKIVSGAVYTYAIVVQSTTVDQARFVPLNATTIIIVNAVTGIVIWDDYKVIESWYGYMCVFLLLGLGCDLLLHSPVALLTEENPEFGEYSKILRRGSNATGFGSLIAGMDFSQPNHHDDEPTEISYKEAWRDVTLACMPVSKSANNSRASLEEAIDEEDNEPTERSHLTTRDVTLAGLSASSSSIWSPFLPYRPPLIRQSGCRSLIDVEVSITDREDDHDSDEGFRSCLEYIEIEETIEADTQFVTANQPIPHYSYQDSWTPSTLESDPWKLSLAEPEEDGFHSCCLRESEIEIEEETIDSSPNPIPKAADQPMPTGTRLSYQEGWKNTLGVNFHTSSAFSSTIKSAGETATQSYQQSVDAMNKASSAFSSTLEKATSQASAVFSSSMTQTGQAMKEKTTNAYDYTMGTMAAVAKQKSKAKASSSPTRRPPNRKLPASLFSSSTATPPPRGGGKKQTTTKKSFMAKTFSAFRGFSSSKSTTTTMSSSHNNRTTSMVHTSQLGPWWEDNNDDETDSLI